MCIVVALGLVFGAMAQSFSLTTASEIPSFEGGVSAFAQKVLEKAGELTVPEGVGTVTVGFYVNIEGKVVMPKVLKGLDAVADESERNALSQALVAAVQSVPDPWKPALDSAGNPMTWYTVVTLPLPE